MHFWKHSTRLHYKKAARIKYYYVINRNLLVIHEKMKPIWLSEGTRTTPCSSTLELLQVHMHRSFETWDMPNEFHVLCQGVSHEISTHENNKFSNRNAKLALECASSPNRATWNRIVRYLNGAARRGMQPASRFVIRNAYLSNSQCRKPSDVPERFPLIILGLSECSAELIWEIAPLLNQLTAVGLFCAIISIRCV